MSTGRGLLCKDQSLIYIFLCQRLTPLAFYFGDYSSIAERRVVDPKTSEHNRLVTPLRKYSEVVKRSGL